MAYNPYDSLPDLPSFELTSEDVQDGKPLKAQQVSGIMGAGGHDNSRSCPGPDFPRAPRASR